MIEIPEQVGDRNPTARLSPDEVDFYRENGYIGVENVFTASEMAELNAVVDEFIERSRSVTEDNDLFNLEPGHTAESPLVARIRFPQDVHDAFNRALRNDRVLDIVSQLIGDDIYYQGGKLNIKPAGVGSGFEWHQDWCAFPHTNDDVLAVGIALEDVLIENGCLLVVPGSHKGPLYDHTQDGFHILAVSPVGISERAVPIELHAGGISLHHARTLHASAPNKSSRSRRVLLYEYVAGDAWPLVQAPEDTWDALRARTLRGTGLFATPRMEKLPVTLPYPKRPRASKGSAIFEDHRALRQSAFTRKN
jgi:phytanoyl-CoA hydroxylase